MTSEHTEVFGSFTLAVEHGIGLVTFKRPPVNSFRVSTYEELLALTEHLETRNDVKVVVLAAGEKSRCWCGGADVNDFADMDSESRAERYEFVNAVIPRFAQLQRPVIAAISGHTIGIGIMLAAVCDIRIAADTAQFATPEINYGLIAGTSRILASLGMPEGLIRELAYTGRRATAHELERAGFIGHVVPKEEVLDRALTLAGDIALKGIDILMTRKRVFVEHEQMGWFEAYRHAQKASSTLVGSEEAKAGVTAFLSGDSRP
ncbi:enoyl-CoA hydratase/isomerase family protein [Leucobacter sp. Z1108]|uniref:enoyl-CoA hydratase/isomerase family protein n=1 Tax=Leucobacter sp. Z1108 TaxID=3439066 RepID=UPI003F368B06